MEFEGELQILLIQIKDAEDQNELDYLRRTYQKKYWRNSIFIIGLFLWFKW